MSMSMSMRLRDPAESSTATRERDLLEAIILVGGQGTRLRPLTLSVPKPLLPTAGVPFLAHQLARVAAAGVTRVVLATAYRAEMFLDAFGDGSAFGLELDYVFERDPLGTGGAIANAGMRLRSAPDDPVLILNGDVLSSHDLSAQLDLHAKAGAAVTLHTMDVPDPARYGCVLSDSDGRISAFLEKVPRPVTNRVNAGCYVFTRRYIDQIPAGKVVSVERETFPDMIEAGEMLMTYPEAEYWLDVGTPEAFVRGCCDLVLGKLKSSLVAAPSGDALLLPGACIDPSARLCGGTVAGAGCEVGPGALVDGSVLFDDVAIGRGAIVSASVVGRGACIGPGAVLTGVIVGDDACIDGGNELCTGLRVWPGVQLGPSAIRFSGDPGATPA